MSQLDPKSSNRSSTLPGSPGDDTPTTPSSNAFSADFLDQLARREPAPATPEADLAGPWRVTALYGAGDHPRWGCIAAGEREPRLVLQAPDLAYLAAAADLDDLAGYLQRIAEQPSELGVAREDLGVCRAAAGWAGRVRRLVEDIRDEIDGEEDDEGG